MKAKKIVGVTCEESGEQAVYVDGKLAREDNTIYMCDLAPIFGTKACIFRHFTVFRGEYSQDDFPPTLAELGDQDEETREAAELDSWIEAEIERSDEQEER